MQMRITKEGSLRRAASGSLPIYWATGNDYAVFYAPRQVCVVDATAAPAALRHIQWLATRSPREAPADSGTRDVTWRAADRVVRAARAAAFDAAEASRQEFVPQCVTVSVNNQCNMRCRYCYSQPDARANGAVSPEAVRAATRLVAQVCARRSIPLTMVFHGGGEPTLSKSQVDQFLCIAREESSQSGVRLQTYIATNGAVSEKTARWLATQFDLVGVSCDGPPAIQDQQRPGRNRQSFSKRVGRTMSTLQRHGRPFHIRATISKETFDHQEEIVTYLTDRHAPSEIRIEPVYASRSGEVPPAAEQAAAFVNSFLAAQAIGAARDVPVTTSITRPDALYGPYCNMLRHVVNLVPGDVVSGCFLDSRPDEVVRRGTQMGSLDLGRGEFQLEANRIRSLKALCSRRPAECNDCPCGWQCTFGCPDVCVLELSAAAHSPEGVTGSFRCLVNRLLLERVIHEAAGEAWARTPKDQCRDVWDAQKKLSVAVCRGGYGLACEVSA